MKGERLWFLLALCTVTVAVFTAKLSCPCSLKYSQPQTSFVKSLREWDRSILAPLLRIGYIKGLWYPGLPKSQRRQRTVRNVVIWHQRPAGDSKIKGTWKQTMALLSSPSINQKVTLSSPLSFSHIYSKNALFFCSWVLCLFNNLLQALVGAHCNIYTFLTLKICFYFLLFLLVCLLETVLTQSLS